MRFYHLIYDYYFPDFSIFFSRRDSIQLFFSHLIERPFFAIFCFITGFIAYSKAVVSSKRDNGSTKRFLDRVTLEESRGRVFQEISVVMVPTIGLRYI